MHAKLPRDNQIVGAVVFAALMALREVRAGCTPYICCSVNSHSLRATSKRST
jgi:hypothetical protein